MLQLRFFNDIILLLVFTLMFYQCSQSSKNTESTGELTDSEEALGSSDSLYDTIYKELPLALEYKAYDSLISKVLDSDTLRNRVTYEHTISYSALETYDVLVYKNTFTLNKRYTKLDYNFIFRPVSNDTALFTYFIKWQTFKDDNFNRPAINRYPAMNRALIVTNRINSLIIQPYYSPVFARSN